MRFHGFIESLLGSKVKVKVLQYLVSENVPTSERELSRILGVSHMAVNKVMKELLDINIVMPMRIGNISAWKTNEKHYAYEFIKQMKYLKPPMEHLKSTINSRLAPYNVEKAVIFGSVAEGKELPDSDIDLLVLVKDNKQKKSISVTMEKLAEECLGLYGNRLSPIVLTIKESKKKENERIVRFAEKGIIL